MAEMDDWEGSDQLWYRGCRGESLTTAEQGEFGRLARARFHTFELSATHALENKSAEQADVWVAGLIRGLVRDLLANPGLEREWHASEFALGFHGQRVSAQLTEAAQTPS